MKAMVAYKGRMYFAEQDRRGRAEEADLVIYKGADEIIRRSVPKLNNVDELRVATVRLLKKAEGGTRDEHLWI